MLIVKEAEKRDVLRQIAQIPTFIAENLGIKTGDIIEIMGKRSTYAKAWRSSSITDQIIKLDPITRKNAGVQLNESVKIEKVSVKSAKSVEIILDALTEAYESYITKYLHDRLVAKGEYLRIELGLGKYISAQIAQTYPSGPVICTPSTSISFTTIPANQNPILPTTNSLQESGVYFTDIGGLDQAIAKIREMIEYPLKYPKLFLRLGVSPPKGLLLYGPPGTGKTMLAKAIASETNRAFFNINGPEIVSKYYGESENKLREIFQLAKQKAPSVIFIDEIDSIAPNRSGETGEAERRLVSQLLTLMDGLEGRGEITIVAATNRPDTIDPALRRGGRFDREISISPPDAAGRLDILRILSRGMPLSDDVDLEYIANRTHGFVGADLSIFVKETALSSLNAALTQSEQSNISLEKLQETLKVTQSDFLSVMATFTPSGMRNVRLEDAKIGWDDIAGLDEIKKILQQIIDWPILYKDLYQAAGLSPSKGVLLYGPSGNGKTLIAKALAHEGNINFISINNTDILSKYVGVAEKAIHDIFMKAKLASPCIIFIDEVDAVISTRNQNQNSNASLLATLLVEMDGLENLGGIIVLAATNRPDIIDAALLRPGRFDRLLFIPNPNEIIRRQLISHSLRDVNVATDVNIDYIVTQTDGYSSAEIIHVIRIAKESRLQKCIQEVLDCSSFTVYEEDILYGLALVKPRNINYDLSLPSHNQSINYM